MRQDRAKFWLRVIVVAQGILLLAAIVLLLANHQASPRTRGRRGRQEIKPHSFLRWLEPLLIDVVAHLVVFYLFMAQGSAPASV
jgi:H+/Cl- antiporter ClcA